MSKKNNKGTKRRLHDFDIQREKEEADKRAKKLAKKNGVQKVKASKGVRIRKGLVVKGIKVTDAESKKKVKKVLAKRAQAKVKSVMEVDAVPAKRNKKAASAGKRAAAGKADLMEQ